MVAIKDRRMKRQKKNSRASDGEYSGDDYSSERRQGCSVEAADWSDWTRVL